MKKLLFILPLLYYSCTDAINYADIVALQTENTEQDAQIDSLLTILTEQQAYIDSLNNAQNIADSLNNLTMQSYIDSLINEGELTDSLLQVYTDSLNTVQNTLNADQQAYIDSLINAGNISDDLLQTYIDSLNTVQNTYIDSLHNAQQTTLTALANSALSAGFVETEVFSASIPSSWTDVDLSSVIGQKQSLVLMRYEYVSGTSPYCILNIRPNGSTDEYGISGNSGYSSVNYLRIDPPSNTGDETALGLIFTDENGIIEHKEVSGQNANVKASVLFYLNQ
jgi:hypothetical protein